MLQPSNLCKKSLILEMAILKPEILSLKDFSFEYFASINRLQGAIGPYHSVIATD